MEPGNKMGFCKIVLAFGAIAIGYNLTALWARHLTRRSYVEEQILLGIHYIHDLAQDIRQHQLTQDGYTAPREKDIEACKEDPSHIEQTC